MTEVAAVSAKTAQFLEPSRERAEIFQFGARYEIVALPHPALDVVHDHAQATFLGAIGTRSERRLADGAQKSAIPVVP